MQIYLYLCINFDTMKDLTVSVSKSNVKQLTSTGGSVITFVNKHWALGKGLVNVLNFKCVHPKNSDYVQITAPVRLF